MSGRLFQLKDTKNVLNVKEKHHYLQKDHEVNIFPAKGVELLKIVEAAEKYPWIKKHIPKPSEGYFLRIKETVKIPLSGCFLIASPKVKQKPTNLIVIEENVQATIRTLCAAELPDLAGSHIGFTKLILKNGSKLRIEHLHKWGKRDTVISSLNVLLDKNSQLNYNYKSLQSPRKLGLITKAEILDNASLSLTIAVDAMNSKISTKEICKLAGVKSRGEIKLRFVGRDDSYVKALSKILGIGNEAVGHLDCQGLLLSEFSKIDLIPELVSQNKTVMLTHEASIGRISEDVLLYLRSRGLTEEEAINLIVTGFLTK
ncbi:MAG: SufD family Fe-S cluster assembly protein [Candidatus Baldrarchaeia archaeon]